MLPALLAWAYFGMIESPDSGGYLDYAQQIRTHSVPSGSALLHNAPGRISLFRIGGFPALLALLQTLCSAGWRAALAVLQIAAQSAIAAASFAVALRLRARRDLAAVAALLPSIGYAAAATIFILTDALSAAAITGAALSLLLRPDWRGALLAGLPLGFATSFREATSYLVLAYIPLALFTRPRILCVALVLLPAWGVTGAQIGWNISRGAGPVLTTSKQIVMVQALLPLIKDHIPVFADDPVFDAAARPTLDIAGYTLIDAFTDKLYAQGFTPVQIANEASRDYAHTWRHFPLAMMEATIENFRVNFLFMPADPQDAIALIHIYKTGQRVDFNRLNVLWNQTRAGSFWAGLALILNVTLELSGTIISLAGLAAPWLRRDAWQMRALWCVPVGLVGLYMPVHLEQRYLIPAVPLICILAALAATRWLEMRHRQSPMNPRLSRVRA